MEEGACYVGGKQVWGELNAAEPPGDGLGDGLGQQRLPHPGQILQQDMTLGEESQQGAVDGAPWRHHHLPYVVSQRAEPLLELTPGY